MHTEDTTNLLEVMDMIDSLTVIMLSQMQAYDKLNKVYTLKMFRFLYVKYTSINLEKNLWETNT